MPEIGLYDSDTGESLKVQAAIDVSEQQTYSDDARLLFTTSKRGRIVQLHSDGIRIHYFMDEERGRRMMNEDSERFGFAPGKLLALADANAPISKE